MALVLLDGFEDMTSGWIGPPSQIAGRNGQAMLLGVSSGTYLIMPTAVQTNSLTVGLAVKVLSPPANANAPYLAFRSDNNVTTHVKANFNSDLSITVEAGGVLRATLPPSQFALNSWFYFEMKALLSDTVGTLDVRVNGVDKVNLTGIDTKNAGTKTVFDTITLSAGTNVSGVVHFDDLYVINSIDTFWGDISVETLYPDGMDTTAWVGSDGDAVNNHLLVNEVGTPVDTTYVMSSGSAYGPAQSAYTTQTPNEPTANISDFTLGADFTLAVAGRISGLKFYRSTTSGVTSRTLKLWDAGGTLLGSATTSSEGSGWNTATLSSPISVTAGQTVRASYENTSASGTVARIVPGAGSIVNSSVTRGQCYYVTPAGTRPTTTTTTDYLVDVSFEPTVAAREVYTCQNLQRANGPVLGVQVNARANKSDSGARGLKVVAKEADTTQKSVYTSQTPASSFSMSTGTDGHRITTSEAGQVVGLRFYRSASATSTSHTLRLWTDAGVQLGNAATSGESGSGWKVATLASPVSLTAGQTVRVALDKTGISDTYVYTGSQPAAITNGTLTKEVNSYGSATAGTFPSSSSTENYFVDIVFVSASGTIRSTADNALTTTFTDYSLPLEKKNDNSAWTVADVNALGIGVEVGS